MLEIEWIDGDRDRHAPGGLWNPLPATNQAALIYKQTGNLRALQILLGHTKIEATMRYLGLDVEDAS